MKKLLLGLIFLAASTAQADNPLADRNVDELMDVFVFATSCSLVINGAEVSADPAEDTQSYQDSIAELDMAYTRFTALSMFVASTIIDTIPGWEKESYEEMVESVHAAVSEFPKESIQRLGGLCMQSFAKFTEKHHGLLIPDDAVPNPDIELNPGKWLEI